jgi:hypothetical protein
MDDNAKLHLNKKHGELDWIYVACLNTAMIFPVTLNTVNYWTITATTFHRALPRV